MSGNVVMLGETMASNEPNAKLIRNLEEILDLARSGDIIAIAYATVVSRTGDPLGHGIGGGWEGAPGSLWPLAAALMKLQARFISATMADP